MHGSGGRGENLHEHKQQNMQSRRRHVPEGFVPTAFRLTNESPQAHIFGYAERPRERGGGRETPRSLARDKYPRSLMIGHVNTNEMNDYIRTPLWYLIYSHLSTISETIILPRQNILSPCSLYGRGAMNTLHHLLVTAWDPTF